MVIVNIKKEDSKKAFKKEAVFKVPKIKGYPTIRIEKGCDFQRNTNFSYSSQPLGWLVCCFLTDKLKGEDCRRCRCRHGIAEILTIGNKQILVAVILHMLTQPAHLTADCQTQL